jgi:hypothetical protein
MASSINAITTGSGGVITTADNSGDLNIQSGGSTKLAVTSAGVAVTGTLSASTTGQVGTTLGVGAATPAASGAGITFPATQSASTDANTLDDYEEGTWTPVLKGTSTAGTASYSTQKGVYTKIGDRVFINCYIEWSSGTGTGNMFLDGLPFTLHNNLDITMSPGENGNIAWTANYGFTPILINNTTFVYLNQSKVGSSGPSLNTPYDAAGYLGFSGSYKAA